MKALFSWLKGEEAKKDELFSEGLRDGLLKKEPVTMVLEICLCPPHRSIDPLLEFIKKVEGVVSAVEVKRNCTRRTAFVEVKGTFELENLKSRIFLETGKGTRVARKGDIEEKN